METPCWQPDFALVLRLFVEGWYGRRQAAAEPQNHADTHASTGFFPEIAPVTVRHIVKLFQLGCYKTNHFFRVDKGFVAQIQTVDGGVRVREESCERTESQKNIPLEGSKVCVQYLQAPLTCTLSTIDCVRYTVTSNRPPRS